MNPGDVRVTLILTPAESAAVARALPQALAAAEGAPLAGVLTRLAGQLRLKRVWAGLTATEGAER